MGPLIRSDDIMEQKVDETASTSPTTIAAELVQGLARHHCT